MKKLIILGSILLFGFPLWAQEATFLRDRVIVKFQQPLTTAATSSPSGTPPALERLSKKYGLRKHLAFNAGSPSSFSSPRLRSQKKKASTSQKNSWQNIYTLVFSGEQDIPAVLKELKADPEVAMVQPCYVYHTNYVPNDPHYAQQWALPLVKLPDAWEMTRGDQKTMIAIIDTGVDWQHPDLTNKIWQNPQEVLNGLDDDGNGKIDDLRGWDFVDDIAPGDAATGEDYDLEDNDPMDRQGHGTHVAGLVAAQTNNSLGIAGGAPNCVIMPLRAGYADKYGGGSFTTTHIANAIQYATDLGVGVINLSLGGKIETSYSSDDWIFENAVKYALANNVVVVTAAGNDNENLDDATWIPGSISGVINVSAVTDKKTKASYSNFGQTVVVAAPGGAGSDNDSESILSTYPNNQYAYMSGTSMAAPCVTGIVALLQSAKPQISTAEVYQVITSTATDLGTSGFDPVFGFGLINTYDALKKLNVTTPQATYQKIPTVDINNAAIITINVTDDFISALWPKVTLKYLFYENGQAVGSWQSQELVKNDTLYTAVLAPFNRAGQLHYYFEISDYCVTQSMTIPTSAPQTNSCRLEVRDISAPRIHFPQQDNDYLANTVPIYIDITDYSGLNLNSLSLSVNDAGTIHTYSLADSNLLSWADNRLKIDISQLNLARDHRISFTLSIEDSKGNRAAQQVQLITQSAELQVYGPAGVGSSLLNAPNPFNPDQGVTKICFQLSKPAQITAYLYSLQLRIIRKLSTFLEAGYHDNLTWDGRDESGNLVPNGVYVLLLKAEADNKTVTKRLKVAVLR